MKPFICILCAIMFLCDSRLPSFATRFPAGAPSRASRNQITAGLQPLCELFVDMEESLASYSVPSVATALGQAKRSLQSKVQELQAAGKRKGSSAAPHSAPPAQQPRVRARTVSSAPHAPRARWRMDDDEESWNTSDEDEDDNGRSYAGDPSAMDSCPPTPSPSPSLSEG